MTKNIGNKEETLKESDQKSPNEQLLKHLNPEQKRAVQTTEGPLLILAGAGSGKTRVVTRRVAWLIRERGVHPGRILAITFTNKAAAEMKDRVEELIGAQSRASWIGTFHSMMLRILRRHGELLGYRPGFAIFDSYDQKRVMAEVLKSLNIGERLLSPQDALKRISFFKNNDLSPEEVDASSPYGIFGRQWSEIFRAYQRSLLDKNGMDFDDILTGTLRLFREHPEVLDHYRDRFQYILVDEYQDTNKVQYELIHLLSSRHKNLCVVGDDDQSIYSFRGATIRNILDFEKDFPDCHVVRLEQNYRSTKTILSAANHIIQDNRGRKSKTLWTALDEGVPIQIYRAADHTEEARYVAREIQRRFQKAEEGDALDIAVLYRMNALSRNLEFALRELGIDYRIYGGTRFYDRAEVKDVTAYLALIQSTDDDIAFRRVINQPRRGIGNVTLERLAELAGREGTSFFEAARRADAQDLGRSAGRLTLFVRMIDQFRAQVARGDLSFAELVKMVEEDSGLIAYYEEMKARGDEEAETRLENLIELISDAIDFERRLQYESLDDMWEFGGEDEELDQHLADRSTAGLLRLFLERAALYSDQDKEGQIPPVSLMTIHNAKGLEFDTVFIVGAEEDIFPSIRAQEEADGIEEERRLAYVAVTRARRELLITSAVSRLLFGQTQYNPLSRFVEAIPEDLTEKTGQFGVTPYRPAFENFRSRPDEVPERPLFGRTRPEETGREPAYQAVTRRPAKPAPKKEGSSLDPDKLSVGLGVQHVSFGPGVIENITRAGDDAILTIRFEKMVKRFMASQSALSLEE
ncbi:MAG TPA: UvrD-helicase domain-containing protein [Clostridiaceae bacterium]|nr:UvrD-helicase domain-containing protein [Clostridiaceae bacterium]